MSSNRIVRLTGSVMVASPRGCAVQGARLAPGRGGR
jgi:hypothetical protein